jgi:hypothetical protein
VPAPGAGSPRALPVPTPTALDQAAIQASAEQGVATPASALPYGGVIQRSFGHHDISSVQAHIGAGAAAAAHQLGAAAYATGEHVVLDDTADLFVVAHEVAHVVQQRAGVHLAHGVGDAGDEYERHADEVAALVVAGKSAEALLDRARGSGVGQPALQLYHRARRGEVSATRQHDHLSEDHDASASAPPSGPRFIIQERTPTSATVPPLDSLPVPRKPSKWQRLLTASGIAKPELEVLPPELDLDVKHRVTERPLPDPQARRRDQPELDLNISDDGQMLIHDTEHEPKEFFATQEIVEISNAKLEATGSAYRLITDSGSLYVAGRELHRVEPRNEPVGDQDHAGFANLFARSCIELAQALMGSHDLQLVLQGPDDGAPPRTTPLENVRDSSAPDQILELAETSSNAALSGAQGRDEAVSATNTFEKYSRASSTPQFAREAEANGINEYARPDVGEAYATFTLDGRSGEETPPAPGPSGREPWPFHFAGVAAVSSDGRDRVTLENYNRRQQFESSVLGLVHRLAARVVNTDLKDRLAKHTDPTKALELFYRKVLMRPAPEDLGEYDALENRAQLGSAWFFRMYGAEGEQTFHARQAASNEFVDPLTVRVAPDVEKARAALLVALDELMESSSSDALPRLENLHRQVGHANTQGELHRLVTVLYAGGEDAGMSSDHEHEKGKEKDNEKEKEKEKGNEKEKEKGNEKEKEKDNEKEKEKGNEKEKEKDNEKEKEKGNEKEKEKGNEKEKEKGNEKQEDNRNEKAKRREDVASFSITSSSDGALLRGDSLHSDP